MVSGGLFNRAEGLWEEIGADLFASTLNEATQVASGYNEAPRCDRRTINRRKKKRQAIQQLRSNEKQRETTEVLTN